MNEKRNVSTAVKAGVITFALIIGIYVGISIYYSSRFTLGSSINSISVSGKTVEEANEELTKAYKTYKLEIISDGKTKGEIKGTDINLTYNSHDEVKQFKEEQSSFNWVIGLFSGDEFEVTKELTYDDEKLKEIISKLDLQEEKVVKSQSATFKYENEKFHVVDEVYGNEINKEKLHDEIVNALKSGKESLDLKGSGCYIEPKIKKDSEEASNVLNTLNKYISSKIEYVIGDDKKLIDGKVINTWVSVNENNEIVFDENKIKAFVTSFTGEYNTVGKTRNFKASSGKTVSVVGGDYGWSVNTAGESKWLIENIKEGKEAKREIEFAQKAFASGQNDIGDTYVEINLTKQHMWFYKNGALITEGDIVTGDQSKKYSTPQGVYRLKYKQKDTVLRGADYESPVTFWMPFNGGIGIHDASWRSTFGGTIYKNNGSHGCVNSPYKLAQAIFNNIEPNTPIVCYFE
ncbi:MAG: L,D-transpeptidase family protein [Clostridium sp.]